MQSKQGKPKEAREVGGIGRNKKRVDLSKEFQEFKQRIQDFQNKNEEIISRIRDAYTVKKKSQQTYPEYLNPSPTTNANPYPNQQFYNNNDIESVTSSCDYSKDVVFEGSMAKHISSKPVRSIYNSNAQDDALRLNQPAQLLPFTRSKQPYQGTYDEYMRGQNMRSRTEEERYQTSPDPTFSGRFGTADPHSQQEDDRAYLEEQYREALVRSQQLEEQLQERQEQLNRLRGGEGRMRSSVASIRRLLEVNLDSFQEEVMGERFLEMEKSVRRCQQRLRNMGIRLRDSMEDRKAKRLIGRSRSKRNSISKPRNKESSISEEADYTPKGSRAHSQSKGRRPDPTKHREFQQIAHDYENMIKTKTLEVEALQRRLLEEGRAKQAIGSQLMKAKAALEEREREISELRKRPKEKEKDGQSRELKQLRERLVRAEEEGRAWISRQKELGQTISRLEKAKKALQQEYSESINKNKSGKQKAMQDLEERLREAQASWGKEAAELRERAAVAEKRQMEKECEVLTLLNRLKKTQNEAMIKEEKLRELQGLLLKDNDHGDLLDRSVSLDATALSHTEARALQETLRRLDQEMEEQKVVIYDLQKEKYLLEGRLREAEGQAAVQSRERASLQARMNDLRRELESCQGEDGKELQRQLADSLQLIEEIQAQKQHIMEEKDELTSRNTQLLEELRRAKEQNLTANRELIRLNSELAFAKNEVSGLETKLGRAKQEVIAVRGQAEERAQAARARENSLQSEVAHLKEEVENLKNHILELETLGHRSPQKDEEILLNSLHVSEISFNYQPRTSPQEEIAALKERLREVQGELEVKVSMQAQVQAEYKGNLDRLRAEGEEARRQLEETKRQLEEAKQQAEQLGGRREQDSYQQIRVEVYQEKILQMEEEYSVLKESEERLNEMLHQILETIKQREEEKDRMLREIEDKDRLIQQMRELLELKESRGDPSKTNRSDTLRDFSLRVSGQHSEEVPEADLSYLSNISEVFKRDDLLEERMKRCRGGREEQAKLFARTSAYIRSLKAIIDAKDKRVKVLQKQLTVLRRHEGHVWSDRERSSGERPCHTEEDHEEQDDVEECDEFKDYDSVQLDTRRSKYTGIVKVLQHEKNLVVEENKLLNKQIEALQDELLRSEEQENSLVRIKDLYKDEIKKLIEKNEVHTKEFQTQIHKLKEQLEASDSFHNLEAIKQLFLKIVPAAATLDDPTAKPARRQEKRKELEEYVKVMSSILQFEPNIRDRLLATLKK